MQPTDDPGAVKEAPRVLPLGKSAARCRQAVHRAAWCRCGERCRSLRTGHNPDGIRSPAWGYRRTFTRDETWGDLQVGNKVTHRFDSGTYEFTVGQEPTIGNYQMCSLFSPAREFADHTTAVATAKEVMQGLMDSNNFEGLTLHEEVIRKAWQGEAGATKPEEPQTAAPTLSEKMAGSISRRDFLRGGRAQR